MNNPEKFQAFLEIAKKLNEEFNSLPVLYGSLGLSKAIDRDLETDDIDLLIEDHIFTKELNNIRQLMASLGYKLIDADENTFCRENLKVGIADDGDMVEFSGVNPERLTVITASANYRVLTAEEYLATYKASLLDSYRRDKHQKNDGVKIELLELHINAERR